MNGLVEYGVSRGTVLPGPVLIDDSEPASISRDETFQKLVSWINHDKVPVAPAHEEASLVFVLLMPTAAVLPLPPKRR